MFYACLASSISDAITAYGNSLRGIFTSASYFLAECMIFSQWYASANFQSQRYLDGCAAHIRSVGMSTISQMKT